MAIGVLIGLVVVVAIGVQLLDYMKGGDDSDKRDRVEKDENDSDNESAYDYPSGQVDWSALPVAVQDKMAQGQIRLHEGDYYQASSDFIDAKNAGEAVGGERSNSDGTTGDLSLTLSTPCRPAASSDDRVNGGKGESLNCLVVAVGCPTVLLNSDSDL